uniref:Uncharacterized protein n=1 Tax=Oryza nivara TaxID=4536 RepID=A0A0E0GU58_ORYNI
MNQQHQRSIEHCSFGCFLASPPPRFFPARTRSAPGELRMKLVVFLIRGCPGEVLLRPIVPAKEGLRTRTKWHILQRFCKLEIISIETETMITISSRSIIKSRCKKSNKKILVFFLSMSVKFLLITTRRSLSVQKRSSTFSQLLH